MPPELDPAFYAYARRRETPTEGMKRIEIEMQDRPNLNPGRMVSGAGQSMYGYNANVGVQGPLSSSLMVAGDKFTGSPDFARGKVGIGPVSATAERGLYQGAPVTRGVEVNVPFDADRYFGLSAKEGPRGRSYGIGTGGGDKGSEWSAYGGYNPASRGVNVGGSYSARFAQGGRASVGHTQAAGVPVTLENHKGDTRHRQDSGDSKMAADYGYLDQSRPDHDGMKTDAFVGPHKDSDKVFVVNQQHPRTGKFNEHKVLLGYKDRAHALRDYVHSFSDGLGHKRIHSVVEMGKHELRDWLKKSHTKPLKKAEGGEVETPAPDPVEPEAYAEGGKVEAPEAAAAPAPAASLDQKVDATVQDVAGLAQDGDIDQRKLAFLLRKASTGTMPEDVSYTFANEIMDHDTPALIDRFGRYPRSIRILSRVDAALGGEAGQSLGPVANEGGGRAGFAKGGKAEKKPYTGDKKAFEQFSQFALQNYGEQVGQNMINRAGGDAAKLMFAMAQYTKNLVAQDPAHADHHRQQIQQLGQLAYANKIDPRAAFNRTPDTMETRKELQDILKSDHKMNPAFKAALERMDKLVGSQ